jgi:four helix bundle protein
MDDFRFEQLEIWKDSIEISDIIMELADKADLEKKFRFAEQLRAACLSISNNIAEGSGSFSDKEFSSFLNIARRSLFECVNILHIFERRKIITMNDKQLCRSKLLVLSKKITNFRKTLS